MKKLRFFLDPIANTISVWFKDPREEVITDVDDAGNILSIDKEGEVFGFEKISFLPERFVDRLQQVALRSPEKMKGALLLE